LHTITRPLHSGTFSFGVLQYIISYRPQ
jgi:hypothetical protein